PFGLPFDRHVDDAAAELEGSLDRVGQAARRCSRPFTLRFSKAVAVLRIRTFRDEAVDHDLDRVALVLIELDRLVEVPYFAVYPHADEAGPAGVFEDAVVLASPVGDHRREDHQPLAFRQAEDR